MVKGKMNLTQVGGQRSQDGQGKMNLTQHRPTIARSTLAILAPCRTPRTCSPWHPRLCAVRAPGPHLGLGTDTPWRLDRFATPPTGNDRWECLGSGDGAGEWWVRVLKKSRVRAFHPLHRGTPFMIERMASTRVTVAFHRNSTREAWKRKEIMDDWINSRNTDLADVYEWRGYSFFYVRFPPRANEGHVGSASFNPTSTSWLGDSKSAWLWRRPSVEVSGSRKGKSGAGGSRASLLCCCGGIC